MPYAIFKKKLNRIIVAQESKVLYFKESKKLPMKKITKNYNKKLPKITIKNYKKNKQITTAYHSSQK